MSSLQLGMSVDLAGDADLWNGAANFPRVMGLDSAKRWERGMGEEIVWNTVLGTLVRVHLSGDLY